MTETNKIDHRTRVAAEKRERMRARLVETALAVFAERGVSASVIQEVISVAGVSQGSFYNHFRTNEELLLAVTEELSNELLALIEGEVAKYKDPAQRIATGVRLYLHKARAFPLLARFIVKAGVDLASPHHLFYEYVPQHLTEAFEAERFDPVPMEVALDLISGQALMAIVRIASGEWPDDYVEHLVEGMLRALGLPRAQAHKIAFTPLGQLELPTDTLAARASLRAANPA